jgi:hypothetical protein
MTISRSSLAAVATLLASSASAFVVRARAKASTSSTTLFLEDWVAKMVDIEGDRQAHLKEYENEWMEKNRGAVLSRIETDFMDVEDPDAIDFRMHRKDQKLAFKDPQAYCADRCVSTGNCDIYEDL